MVLLLFRFVNAVVLLFCRFVNAVVLLLLSFVVLEYAPSSFITIVRSGQIPSGMGATGWCWGPTHFFAFLMIRFHEFCVFSETDAGCSTFRTGMRLTSKNCVLIWYHCREVRLLCAKLRKRTYYFQGNLPLPVEDSFAVDCSYVLCFPHSTAFSGGAWGAFLLPASCETHNI